VTRQRQAAEDALAVARQEAEERARQAAEDATGTVGSIRVEEVKAATREAFLPKKKDERWEDLDDWYGSDGDGSALENTLDSVLSDVFMATENIYNLEPAEASGVVLDQAMKHVRAEAGSVFLVELNTALQDLVIAAARGPIARNLEGLKLPRGKGIVGFSALKGIKLTVSNVQRNPNFYGKLDQQFGFRTRSLLCIPIVFEERLFGVLEMVNRVDGEEWTSFDHNVVESLANLLGKVLNVRAGLIALNL